jgi:two-component system, cell cycle sensor histidine kinase and response regulator CckA
MDNSAMTNSTDTICQMSVPDRDISCYTTSLIASYAVAKGILERQLFDGLQDFKDQLCNPLEWIDGKIVVRFFDNYVKSCGGGNRILEQTGIDISVNQMSHFQLMFLRIAPLSLICKTLKSHTENNVSKSFTFNLVLKGKGLAQLKTKRSDPAKYSKAICFYNKGCAIGLLRLRGLKNIQVKETCCAAESESDSCIWDISWDHSPALLQTVRNFFHVWFSSQKSIITHMEQNHKRLKEQYQEILSMRDFYSHIMENMGEAVVWLDKDGSINFTNNSFLSLIGSKKEETHGKLFSDYLLNSQCVDEYLKVMVNAYAHPLVPQNGEFLFTCGDGGKKFGQTSIIWVPGEHRDPGYLITIRDVTDKKLIEQQLYVEKDKHRALYENSPALIIGLDVNGKFIYANPAMVEQCGYSEEELKSMTFKQLVAPEAHGSVDGLIDRLLNQPTRLQEVHFKTKAGEWKSIALSTYQIFDAEKTLAGIAGVGVDVTETKRLNEQLIRSQRMQLLGQMAGEMSHDFKNLLVSISGYSSLILQGTKEQKVLNYAGTIEQVCLRASDLLKNLLAFSRGGVSTVQKFDVNEIIREIAKLMNGIVPESITIAIDTPETPLYILGDPGKIHQCVLNLCVNANDAMSDREGSITIRAKKAEGKSDYVWIQVDDTGCGILPDIIDKIFDPFFTTKKKTGGTGLGLSVVYGIVTAHKGEVLVDSRPGEGTTFTLELPEYVDKAMKVADGRKTIMVIDDDDLPRTYCMDILKNYGYKAVDFSKVKDAEDWLRDHANETWFVLSDVIMPDMNVDDFLATCKNIKSDFTCIWMSGAVTPEMDKYSRLGRFLKKPFTPTALIETIKGLKVN